MENYINLNFTLTNDSESKTLRLYKSETIKSVKILLRRGLVCQTSWTPQQLHYKIKLYNKYYKELTDDCSLKELINNGILWNNDDIQIIIEVDSGRVIHYYDKAVKILRDLCLGVYLEQIREDPNHNYMFSWNTVTDEDNIGNNRENNSLDNTVDNAVDNTVDNTDDSIKCNTYISSSRKNKVIYPPSNKLQSSNTIYSTVDNLINAIAGVSDRNISDPELETPLINSSGY